MRRAPRNAGFTLVEIMVVMTIIGLLMALVAPNILRNLRKAEQGTARAQVANLSSALDQFRMDCGRYPSTQEGLGALMQKPVGLDRWDGPYLNKNAVPGDPWGRAYQYRSPGEGGRPYDVYSLGADNSPGGAGENADVMSWDAGRG